MKLALLKKALPGLKHSLAHSIGATLDQSPYSHSNLIFKTNQSGSSWSDTEGVAIKNVEYEEGYWDFFQLPDHLEKRARAWYELNALKRTGYDSLGVLRFGLPLFREAPLKYFCHEAHAEALGFSEPWRCGPGVLLSRCKDQFGAFQVDTWEHGFPELVVHPAIVAAGQGLTNP